MVKEEKGPQHPAEERPEEENIVSGCCGAEFGPPGWPDCDICSECGEHLGVYDESD